MRSKKNVETLKLKDGEYLEKPFDNYLEMAESAVDWTLFCTYQLKPDFSEGIHKILQLPSMQIAFTDMRGGIMFDYVAPEECITISLMQHISQKACIDQMKLETSMIAVVDDKKVYNFVCSDQVELLDISFNKNADPLLLEKLAPAVEKYYWDKGQKIITLIKGIIDRYDAESPLDTETSAKIETEITTAILALLNGQEAQEPHFTKSEKIALKIKRELFKHMDHNMTVASLAKKHHISIKSLQNAFKSLFGITPNHFMRLLKLNLVHHELLQSGPAQITVQRAAQKWGFAHMGNFSRYYQELFGEKPSTTLCKDVLTIDGMKQHCVERQEEIV